MDNKKVGIVTYHKALSYGACLQAFATYRCLSAITNYDVGLVDYENEYEARQKSWRFLFSGKPKEVFTTLVKRLLFRNEYFKKRAFDDFISKEKVYSLDEANECDILISGSDQIWNPKISDGIDDKFLLNFGKPKCKISVASSMGGYVLTESEKDLFSKLLSKYDFISVREEFTRSQLIQLVDKEIYKILDPTLLLTANQWRDIVLENKDYIHYKFEKNSYILAFTIGESHENEADIFITYSKRMGLPVYKIMLNTFKPKGVDKVLAGANPYEFIDLIDNAAFVITNSFHGTAFSLNLNTPFLQLKVPGNNQRMDELLKLLEWDQNENFEIANSILEKKREEDLKWLINALVV